MDGQVLEKGDGNGVDVSSGGGGCGDGGTDKFIHPRYAISRADGQIIIWYPPYADTCRYMFHYLGVNDVMYEMKLNPHRWCHHLPQT